MGQMDKAEQSRRPGQQHCAAEEGQDRVRDGKALEMPTARLGLSSQRWGAPAGFAPKQPSALQHPQQEALVWGFKGAHDANQN